jgi:hypothetical protein
MIRRHRQGLFVVTGAQLNAIADALDRDVPLAGEGLDFIQGVDGRTFFIPDIEIGGSNGREATPDLPALPDPQVVPGRALNALQAAIQAQRGFAGSGVGMKAGTRGRIFSVVAPFITPPFPPPPPPPDGSSGSSADSSSGSGSGSGSGGGGGGPDPDPDSSSSSSSGS